jgi:cation transport ATPase
MTTEKLRAVFEEGNIPEEDLAVIKQHLESRVESLETSTRNQGEKITNDQIAEVISKGQVDGEMLFRVADAFYKIVILINLLIGILGIILTFVYGSKVGFGLALGTFLMTLLTCAIVYTAAVFVSHGAKVLVHILFSNLAILERGSK